LARGREGMAKRERERRRDQRQEEKRARRESLAMDDEPLDAATEARLMDEFRVLSERHAAGQITDSMYETERSRIFEDLGLEDG